MGWVEFSSPTRIILVVVPADVTAHILNLDFNLYHIVNFHQIITGFGSRSRPEPNVQVCLPANLQSVICFCITQKLLQHHPPLLTLLDCVLGFRETVLL